MPVYRGVCIINHYDEAEFAMALNALISENEPFRPEITFKAFHTGVLMHYTAFVTFWEDGDKDG